MSDNRPIGFLDSGLGGLLVAHTVSQKLPNENLVCYADLANLPYGGRSKKELQALTIKACDELIAQNCKAIVIACNSASVASTRLIQAYVGSKIPIFDMVTPTVEHLNQSKTSKSIALIGTEATVRSRAHATRLNKTLNFTSIATPGLCPMIEECFALEAYDEIMLEEIAGQLKNLSLDTLILACTHYPVVGEKIKAKMKQALTLIDPAAELAAYLETHLKAHRLLNESTHSFTRIIGTRLNAKFLQSARKLFPNSEPVIWRSKNRAGQLRQSQINQKNAA